MRLKPTCSMIQTLCVALLLISLGASPGSAAIGFRQVTSTYPVAVQRGTSAEVELRSNFTLDETYAVFCDRDGVTFTFAETEPKEAPRKNRGSPGTPFRFQVEAAPDALSGVVEYRVATRQAVSSVAQIMVTDYPVVLEEKKQNGTPQSAQLVNYPAAVCGVCEAFEDVDCYQFDGRAGQQLRFEIFAQRVTDKIHGMVVRGPRIYLMDPIITLIGPNGQVIAQNDNFFGGDALLIERLPSDGRYTLEVRDARYAGDERYTYCVEISDRPYALATLPMAVERGRQATVELVGEMCGDQPTAHVEFGDDETAGWRRMRLESPRGPTNPLPMLVSDHPEIVAAPAGDAGETAAQRIELPVGISGRLARADDEHRFIFTAKKGERLHFEVDAWRHGLPLDSVLELYDEAGKLLTEADDFSSPAVKDSRLLWTAPADGDYTLLLRDLHGRGGREFVYHLRAEPALPDFELSGEFYYAMLAPGGHTIWFARVERLNGFAGPVRIEVENLPAGVTQTPVTMPAGMDHCAIILSAAKDAEIDAADVRVRGVAEITDKQKKTRQVVRYGRATCEQQSSGGGQSRWPIETQIVAVTRPLDLRKVEASTDAVTLEPGGTAEFDVHIERSEGFDDPVTLATEFDYFKTKFGEQLPPGVKLSNKSKLRLVGKTLAGKIVLEADPAKAVAVEQLPIAALARVSVTFSITTNYCTGPVLLTVKAPDGKAPDGKK